MAKEERRQPELRFKGFTADWEQQKINDVALINPNTSVPDEFEYVDLESVVGTEMISHRTIKKIDAPSRAKRLAKIGDVFFQTVRPYQKNNYHFDLQNDNFVFSTGYAQLRPVGDSYFLFSRLQEDKFVLNVLNMCTGTSYPAINANDLGEIKIFFPKNLKEEIKIGSFLRNLDLLIALHQRKFDILKDLKEAYLQQIFPEKTQNIPKLRFKSFSDEWKQRKLGDLGKVSMNKRIFKDQTFESGDVPFYKIGTFGGVPDAYISRELFEDYKSKYPYPTKGDILISASGSIGRTVVYQGGDEYFQDSNIVWLNHEGRIDNKFLNQFYSIVKWEGLEGSTIKRLYNKNILETSIKLPTLTEQKKIGGFFDKFDKIIDLHQRKLDSLERLKSSYLQMLFPQ